MAPPVAWDIYAAELRKGYEHPTWLPEPSEDAGRPEKGDVGYILEGRFQRLFNVTKPPGSYHEKASYSYSLLDYDPIFDEIRDNALQTKVTNGSGGDFMDLTADVGANVITQSSSAGTDARRDYTCTQGRGATLLLKDNATLEGVILNNVFPTYMKKHHINWMKQVQAMGLDAQKVSLVLVCGTVKTIQRTVATFQNTEKSVSGTVRGAFLSTGNIECALSSDVNANSVEYHSGTRAVRDGHPSSPTPPSTAVPMAATTRMQNDQCIILQYYQIKYRVVPWQITSHGLNAAAAADHREISDPDKDGDTPLVASAAAVDDTDRSRSSVCVGTTEVTSPLEIVLDYILSNSDADVAVACEGDIDSLFVATGRPATSLKEWLDSERPTIAVEDGLGILSLKEAIARERRDVLGKIIQGADAHLNIIGEGQCLLGKDLADGESFEWPHLMLSENLEGTAITSVSLAPGGDLLATGSDDGAVRVWSIGIGRLLRKWKTHEDVVWAVAFSPDGQHVASGSADALVILWDPHGEAGRLEGHTTDVWSVTYSPDGRKLASGSGDQTVMIWDPETLELLHTLGGHMASVMNLAFTAGGKRLVSCADASGRIWDVETGAHLATLQGHTNTICSMAMSNAGDRVITGSEDHSARIWDCETGQELVTIDEHTGPIWAVAFSPDDTEVVTGSYDTTLTTNDSFSGEWHQTFTVELPAIVDSVAYSSDGKYIASGAANGTVKLWDRHDGSMIAQWRGHSDRCKSARFVNGNRDILTSSDDGSVRIWSVRDVLRVI